MDLVQQKWSKNININTKMMLGYKLINIGPLKKNKVVVFELLCVDTKMGMLPCPSWWVFRVELSGISLCNDPRTLWLLLFLEYFANIKWRKTEEEKRWNQQTSAKNNKNKKLSQWQQSFVLLLFFSLSVVHWSEILYAMITTSTEKTISLQGRQSSTVVCHTHTQKIIRKNVV